MWVGGRRVARKVFADDFAVDVFELHLFGVCGSCASRADDEMRALLAVLLPVFVPMAYAAPKLLDLFGEECHLLGQFLDVVHQGFRVQILCEAPRFRR